MVVLKVIFLLSKNLIDPSVVKVSPYYFLYGKYLEQADNYRVIICEK